MLQLRAQLPLCEAADPFLQRDDLAIRNERSGFLLTIPSTTSGYFAFSRIRFREEIQVATTAKDKAALPVHFGSNNHRCREKYSSVRAANMGAIHFGCARFLKQRSGVNRQSVEQVAFGHQVHPSPFEVRISPSSLAASIRAEGSRLISIAVRVTVVMKTGTAPHGGPRRAASCGPRCIENQPLARDLVFPLLPLQHVRLSRIFSLDSLHELRAPLARPNDNPSPVERKRSVSGRC
jgi:hypothetical protein